MYTRNQSQSYSRHDRRGVTFQSLGYHPAPQRRKSWVVATALLAIVHGVRTLAPNGILRQPAQVLIPDSVASRPQGLLQVPSSRSGPVLALAAQSRHADKPVDTSLCDAKNLDQDFAPPSPVLIFQKVLDDGRVGAEVHAFLLVVWVFQRQAVHPIDARKA